MFPHFYYEEVLISEYPVGLRLAVVNSIHKVSVYDLYTSNELLLVDQMNSIYVALLALKASKGIDAVGDLYFTCHHLVIIESLLPWR